MSRHESLADQLKALLEYRNRPEGKPETVKSNWKTIAANDNNPEDLEGLHIERRRSMRPTELEIMESVKTGEVERNDNGQIIRVGKLRFSDGSQTERAFRYSIDGKLIEYDAPMPVGAMLGTRDRQERILGGDTITSNSAYTLVYGGKHPNKAIKKSKEARDAEKPAPFQTKAEMRAGLASLPDYPVTVCKTGFPWKPSNLRELFMGLEKGRKGETGSIAWEDISTHIVEREVWAETMAALTPENRSAIEATETARSFYDIGTAAGQSKSYADKGGGGKKRLLAANDNLVLAMKKSAA